MAVAAPPPSANVQLEHGYTRLANTLLAALNLAPWDSPSQQKILGALIRVTYGVRKTEAPVGMSAWRSLTDLSDASIKRALDTLQRNGVIRIVREEDAKRCIPKTWALQKDYTRWKRFRVTVEDVEAAEDVAAHGIRTPPGSATTPGTTVTPGTELNPGSPTTPDPGSRTTPGPGTPVTPGHASEPLSHNGSGPPKERERQERKNTPPAESPPAGRTARADLVEWLGRANTGALDRFVAAHPRNASALDSIRATFAAPSMVGDRVWCGLAEGDRPPILEEALDVFAGEGRQYQALGFRIVIEERVKRARNGHGAALDEPSDAPLTAEQMARYRKRRGELEDGGMEADQAAEQAMREARET